VEAFSEVEAVALLLAPVIVDGEGTGPAPPRNERKLPTNPCFPCKLFESKNLLDESPNAYYSIDIKVIAYAAPCFILHRVRCRLRNRLGR
jgi:hypothetical protein